MPDPLWAQGDSRRARLQYQTTAADCCHETFSSVGQKAGPFELAPVAGAPRYSHPHPLVGITTKILTHSSNQLTDGPKKSTFMIEN